jgi:exoribonuclease R
MTVYKITINNRDYNSWLIYEVTNFKEININIDPLKERLFNNDIFKFDENGKIIVLHSSVRVGTPTPAVLVLHGNKTYGRNKKGKLLYKCVPDDTRIPTFLIPYEMKNMGFSKVFTNMYVTFSYVDWDDKHPTGVLTNMIGPVDVLDNFYEYQLYCKSLNTSIQQFQKDTSKVIQSKSNDAFIESIKQKYPSIEDRTDQSKWHIFTIDPPKSTDWDDGFSICNYGDCGGTLLSIYISNVTIWLDVLNLWDSFSRRISTIYLPDRKRPMLPTVLSDCLCSLQSNNTRIALVMDVYIENETLVNIEYKNCMIRVAKNYCYEDCELLANPKYNMLLEVTKKLSKRYKYYTSVRNSHDVVCYLMIFMNYYCAKELLSFKTGIFRSTIMKRNVNVPDELPENVSKYIKMWNSATGQYVNAAEINDDDEKSVSVRHELLDIDAYIHITSPIRRLVDLLNIIQFQQKKGIIQLSENVNIFYDKWLKDLEYINTTMRAIRKVQTDCSLLELCANHPDIMNKEYDGYVFDKIIRNDCLYQFIVFLPELKMASRITLRENIENFENRKFKLYLFNDEEQLKKKIRLHMIEKEK